MTQDLTRGLIAKRVKVGPYTPEGRRYSNLAGQAQEVPLLDTDWRRANLAEAIRRQIAGIEQIQRDGGQYVHGNHGAQR